MITKAQYGPWAVIPGGSEGVGTSFARQLGRAGINLVLIARKPGPLEETAAIVRQESGVEVRTLQQDLTAPDMLEKVAAATEGLEVGLLIYNAGAAHGAAPFLEQPLERSLQLIRLNPVGQVSLAWHFGQGMAARGRGGIVLIGSGAGVVGTGGVAVYAAAKAFTHTLAEGLWAELGPQGVDVIAMPLGRTATPANLRTNITDVGDPLTFPADPDEMARQCLANLANGPVLYPQHLEEVYARLTAMPRREAVRWMNDFLKKVKAGG
jgi:short-subunit dehydrogenase